MNQECIKTLGEFVEIAKHDNTIKPAPFRKFQVRDFGDGTYSVIYNLDLPNDVTEVYENIHLINLSYDDAVIKARKMEEDFKNGMLLVNTKDTSEWDYIYTI